MNSTPTVSTRAIGLIAPTQAQITALAHEIWRDRGCPEGSDIDIWLEAERQLNGALPVERRRDAIPADMNATSPDEDPAINPATDREIRGEAEASDRGSTAYGL